MTKSQKLSCFLIAGYIVVMSGLLAALLTDHWAEKDGYHFGVLKYCVDNTSSCQEVTDKLPSIEAYLLASRYSLISSGVVGFLCLMVCLLCCKMGRKATVHARIHVTGTLLIASLDTCALITFVIGNTRLPDVYQMGWSFFVAVSIGIFTGVLFFILLTSTLYCNKTCYTDTSSVRDSREKDLVFMEHPRSISVNIGETVSINARIINANHVYWCKGRDHVISISTSFEEAFTNQHASLTLKNARPQDDGEYTCVAETYGKNKQVIKQMFSIFVHRVKPVFKAGPKDVTVYLGNSLNLEAIVDNAETVTWLHEGIALSNSKNKIAIKFLHGRASLRIKEVTKDNEGIYTCCAKAGVHPLKIKEESVHCNVKIKDAEVPSFSNVPTSVDVKVHKTLEIALKVHGFPLPKEVSWFKDGERLQMSSEINLQYLEGDVKLVIHDTGPLDAGLYKCCAVNNHGNSTCKIPVKIIKDEIEVECAICKTNPPTRVLQCGHAFCSECTSHLRDCAICREPIRIQTPLYL